MNHANEIGLVFMVACIFLAYFHAKAVGQTGASSELQRPFSYFGPILDPLLNGLTYGGLVLTGLRSLDILATPSNVLSIPPFDRAVLVALLLAMIAWSVYRPSLMFAQAFIHLPRGTTAAGAAKVEAVEMTGDA